MTKKELKAYKQLLIKKEKLEAEIRDIKAECKTEYVADIAKDYSTGQGIPFKIEGMSDKKYTDKINQKEKLLSQINQRIDKVDRFIDKVFREDELIGNILHSQYKENKTIEEIAEEQGDSVDKIKKKLQKFWQNRH